MLTAGDVPSGLRLVRWCRRPERFLRGTGDAFVFSFAVLGCLPLAFVSLIPYVLRFIFSSMQVHRFAAACRGGSRTKCLALPVLLHTTT